MKKTGTLFPVLAAALLLGCSTVTGYAGETTETLQESDSSEMVASPEEMVQAEDIVEDDMVPIYADSLQEGTYSIEVLSSSSMFKIYDCVLTVADGSMNAVLTIDSDSYLKLFMGTGAEAASAAEDDCISYELDENGRQTYEVPVEALDMGINCASFSRRKEKWYDRVLVFSSRTLPAKAYQDSCILTAAQLALEDGTYTVEAALSGGSGKTTVESPTTLTVKDGNASAVITFSSSNYDYVLVNDEKYERISTEGNSSFEIPVTGFDWEMPVKANSTAMGLSHEIDYTLYFDSSSIQAALPDGIYTPDQFTWSGGSGKVEITCDQVEIRGGQAFASITFDSSAYSCVTVDGTQYSGMTGENSSTFEIPVKLNENNTLTGTTTKMSSAHEITYSIYVYLEAAAGKEAKPENAPSVAGLTYQSEIKLNYAKNVKLYHYNDGIVLIETAREQYLVVPEGIELPAGLEKEFCVIAPSAIQIYTVTAENAAQADFRQIVLDHYDLAVIPENILEEMDEAAKEQLLDGFETLGIPVFIDCSVSEASEEARAEWEIVYQVLQGTESQNTEESSVSSENAPELPGLSCTGQLKLDFAQCYDVYFYENDYALIDIYESGRYLLIPEGMDAPEGIDKEIVLLYQPLDSIYLQATSAMALFCALDALDHIRMTGTQANSWYIEEAVERLNSGEMLFAGKYSEPDYEMLVEEGCDLAIESTMLLHTPKVKEMIEMLGIPVLIERASYETHPLGRTEWIKLYGVLLNQEQEAADYFKKQKKIIDDLSDFENTEKTVAFFYVNTDGTIVVRRDTDYIPKMIEIAGGRYVYEDDWQPGKEGSSVYLTMEEFYAAAHDADYLVYNASISDELHCTEDLIAQNELFAEFQAVKEGHVWTTSKYLFQATDIVGNLITDLNQMLTGESGDQMTFLKKVD